jgi:ABC-type Fe3+-hydroxamate transport system substrate-binding protein
MKRILFLLISLAVLLSACGSATSAPGSTSTGTSNDTGNGLATQTPDGSTIPQPPGTTQPPYSNPTLVYPLEGFGPTN